MIRYFVGVPGAGKTTIAVKLIKDIVFPKNHKLKYDYIFNNFEVNDLPVNFIENLQVLSNYKLPQYSYLSIDESGIEFNSRDFKNFSKGLIEHFKLLRHEFCDCDVFSQSYGDTDKIIRDLANEIWLIRSIGPLSYARCVYKKQDIGKDTEQLKEIHYWKSILWQLIPGMPKQFIFCWRPSYYKYFNSFSPIPRDVLPGNHIGTQGFIEI